MAGVFYYSSSRGKQCVWRQNNSCFSVMDPCISVANAVVGVDMTHSVCATKRNAITFALGGRRNRYCSGRWIEDRCIGWWLHTEAAWRGNSTSEQTRTVCSCDECWRNKGDSTENDGSLTSAVASSTRKCRRGTWLRSLTMHARRLQTVVSFTSLESGQKQCSLSHRCRSPWWQTPRTFRIGNSNKEPCVLRSISCSSYRWQHWLLLSTNVSVNVLYYVYGSWMNEWKNEINR